MKKLWRSLQSRFYRWLFAKAFPDVTIVPQSWHDARDLNTYLHSKPIRLLTAKDIELMSSEVYRFRLTYEPEFKTRVNELCT